MGVFGVTLWVFGVFVGVVFIIISMSGSEPLTPIIILRKSEDVLRRRSPREMAAGQTIAFEFSRLLEFYPHAVSICREVR